MFCPYCGRATEEGANFCGNCGRSLSPKQALVASNFQSGSTFATESQLGKKSHRVRNAALIILIVGGILVASVSGIAINNELQSMNNYKLVSSFSPTQVQTCNSTSRTVEKLNPDLPIIANYDEQIHLDFNQNFSSLEYNVTATEQNDSFGFGPTYLLDGATSAGLWYQTGLSWNWAISNSLAHYSGFQFAYEVWNVTSGKSVFPNALDTTSITSLNGNVNPGDLVELSLKFQNGNVIMSLRDWETGVFLQQNYSADSANYFTSGGTGGYSTGLMLEWYHVYPIFCTQNHVIFSTTGLPLSSATLCNDEWNLTNNDHNVYYGTCTGPIELPQELTQAAAFSYNGTISYANAHEFVVF